MRGIRDAVAKVIPKIKLKVKIIRNGSLQLMAGSRLLLGTKSSLVNSCDQCEIFAESR